MRHPFSRPARSRPPNQWSACESPSSTSVVFEVLSPNSHHCVVSTVSAQHPCNMRSERAAANGLWSGSVVRRCAASIVQCATPAAPTADPTARSAAQRTGTRETHTRPILVGSSISRYVIQASTSASADHASLPATPIRQSSTAPTPTNGQCQRYHAYDILPNQRSQSALSARLTNPVGANCPPASMAAVPNAGSIAAMPGYGVPRSYSTTASTIAAAPTNCSALPAVEIRAPIEVSCSASTPPSANSQMRVGSPKNAQC